MVCEVTYLLVVADALRGLLHSPLVFPEDIGAGTWCLTLFAADGGLLPVISSTDVWGLVPDTDETSYVSNALGSLGSCARH